MMELTTFTMRPRTHEVLTWRQITESDIKTEERLIATLLDRERRYKKELDRLERILRGCIWSKDPLPIYNIRQLIILVKRLCKDSEVACSLLEDGQSRGRKHSKLMEHATSVWHSVLCVSYTDSLDEARQLLRREMDRRGDSTIAYCTELHCERALLPYHRLLYLKNLGCISSLHRDALAGTLDRCFEISTFFHGPQYSDQIDRLLQLGLRLSPPPPLHVYDEIKKPALPQEGVQTSGDQISEEDYYEEIAVVASGSSPS